jgi:hypothetical protein
MSHKRLLKIKQFSVNIYILLRVIQILIYNSLGVEDVLSRQRLVPTICASTRKVFNVNVPPPRPMQITTYCRAISLCNMLLLLTTVRTY